MNGRSNFWVYLFVLAAGIFLICKHNDVNFLNWLIMIIGVFFLIPGIIGLICSITTKGKSKGSYSSINSISAIGSIIIGGILILWPGPFAAVFVYVLAVMLIIGGIIQIWMLGSAYTAAGMPWWLYILPVLSVIAGVVMICSSLRTIQSAFTLIAGIGLVAIAANSLFIYLVEYNVTKKISTGE